MPTPKTWRAALLALPCLLPACSSGEAYAVDLLARHPDALAAQTGQLVPRAETGFGESERAGFEPAGADEPVVAWTDRKRASLFLDAVDPEDRTLALELRSPNDTIAVELRLNGHALGEVEATSTMQTVELAAPAGFWQRGSNVLEIEPAFMHRAPDGAERGVGIARVSWGERVEASVDASAMKLALASGAGASWALEGPFEAIHFQLTGAGATAELHLHRMDPLFGGTERLASHKLGLSAGTESGAFEFELPDPGSGVLLAELVARSEVEVVEARALAPDHPQPPPIVFVSVDTFAAKHMSAKGFDYERNTTPRLAAFADDATSFLRCRANAPFTLSSYLSQLTGMYPAAHAPAEAPDRALGDVEDRGAAYSMQHLDERRWTLAEALRAAGYKTAAFVDNPWLDRGFGFRQGFDVYDATAARINQTDPTGGAAHILPLAEEWLDGLAEGEVPFLFIQVIDLHYPYVAVSPWDEAFEQDGLLDQEHELPVAPDDQLTFGTIPNLVARGILRYGKVPTKMKTAPVIDAYDQKIFELDERIGAFFDFLHERGIWEDAVVVVGADHGEAMLEHEYYFNHGLLYEEHLQVPLFVRLPRGEGAGAVVEAQVQMVDLYPTLLELAGLDARREYLHGRSLVPALRGESLDPLPSLGEGGIQKQRTIELDGWKLIESEPSGARFPVLSSHPRITAEMRTEIEPLLRAAMEEAEAAGESFDPRKTLTPLLREALAGTYRELYYLPDDPFEQNDLAAEEPDRVTRMSALLVREKQRGIDARMIHAPEDGAISEALADELRSLGYAVDGGE